MTFVVGSAHEDKITLVGDTKVIDQRRGFDKLNRHVYENLTPKCFIVRPDLAIGVAGDNPASLAREAWESRHLDAGRAASHLAERGRVALSGTSSFIVAGLSPGPQIYQVTDGSVSDRTSVGRSFIGVEEADVAFRKAYKTLEMSSERAIDFYMWSALQEVIVSEAVDSVGGFATRVFTAADGFRLGADQFSTGPDEVQAVVDRGEPGPTLRITPTSEVASLGFAVQRAVGRDPTRGAQGFLIPEARLARLFPHDRPWSSENTSLDTMTELLIWAREEHRQFLHAPERLGF